MSPRFESTQPPVVQRGRSRLTPNGWIEWRPVDVHYEALGPEWIWRGLREVDLTDPASVLTTLDRVGMIWGSYEALRDDNCVPAETPYPPRPLIDGDQPVRNHLTDAVAYLETLHAIADEWVAYAEGTTQMLSRPFTHALDVGLRPFTLIAQVQEALFPVQHPPVVDLYEAGCWQLAQTILANPDVRRCANVNCGRVFFQRTPQTTPRLATARAKYCSEYCKKAHLQRAYRARRAHLDY